MKYKVEQSSDLYLKLTEFHEKYKQVRSKLKQFCDSIGAVDYSTNNFFAVIGRINGIHFSEEPDVKLWRSVGPKYMKLYMPKAKNKTTLAALKELPYLPEKDFEVIFNNPQRNLVAVGDSLGIFTTPGLKVAGNDFLLSVPAEIKDYKPLPGMIEILESEYHKIIENHSNQTAEAGK